MKLPTTKLNIVTSLAEFDIWITSSLGGIKETERFQQEMEKVVGIFDAMGASTNNFARVEDCRPEAITDTFIKQIEGQSKQASEAKLQALASVLFLVSGKSDNNAKCQFPLHLRDVARWHNLPRIKGSKKAKRLVFDKLPRVLTASQYMKRVASLGAYQDHQKRLLQGFINFILSDSACISQLWGIGHSYFRLKSLKKERDLLTPLVVFQVRGSVSASGGHQPEEDLRKRLLEWGLRKNIDYNTTDVNLLPAVAETAASKQRKIAKQRGYDFVLPYQTPNWTANWGQRIFIQCQFYAGDSGSVSHKSLDQTKASRQYVLSLAPDARFVEYVDGAGYFSALNGDLKKLLEMSTTSSFFQVRSAAIRLRRELQHLGFLMPLELEHAIIRCHGDRAKAESYLTSDGYSQPEINRCFHDCIQRALIKVEDNDRLSLTPERRIVARRYFMLDVVAQCGKSPSSASQRLGGYLMVPGYGPFYGMKLNEIVSEALGLAPSLREDWSNPETITGDIRLCDEGLVISC